MNTDEHDSTLAARLSALRDAMQEQHAPPRVEDALMAAFATQVPQKRWYHTFSPRQWGLGAGSGAAVAAMALVLTLHSPASLDAGTGGAGMGMTVNSIDEGSPFIALESMERIEQEANPQVLEADVPRTALASLGLPVDPENAGDSVRAEMLVGADGSPLALRLVSPP